MAAIKLSSLTGVRKSYAQLLALEYGQCTFLHYGLISEAQQQQDYQQQQQAFADKLLDLAQESISDTAFVLLDGRTTLAVIATKLEEPLYIRPCKRSKHTMTVGLTTQA